ncbi:hypothetical protein [Lichenibacterium ramalinae]|uniref:Integrase catalytic domain-containing protein n=1 Tax=Lichenibacterium ramalinae TaxID=2316527 RepID=A0A4Q2R985_9HYPH|nr:hypothetical protein [Lichenibacterium ramalinae]RYB02040.1 hypothetical protein D3272_23015 [Lichenibacterium ramalinae]
MKLDDAEASVRNMRFHIIGPVLKTKPGTPERAVATKARAAEVFHLDGKPFAASERSIQRWAEKHEAEGFAGLTRRKRKGAGERAAVVSRAWDKAVKLPKAAAHTIATELAGYIGGLVKAGESPSIILRLAREHLLELTRQAGSDLSTEALLAACAIPVHLIRRAKDLRKVHRFKTDRKAHEDARSRISRTRAGLLPNDVWVVDVHPLDIGCRRENGTIAYPRGIATLDLATNRIRVDWVLLDEGKGITARHVIAHTTATIRIWGGPRAVYGDNGSEYRWLEFIDDALKLMDRDGRRLIPDLGTWEERRSNIVRARAYNAPAKPIEGIFGVLERKYFHVIPGWVAGDRTRKKSANVGREPEPFPGTFAELRELLNRYVDVLYAETPQFGSALGGKSPNDALRAFISDGWQRVDVEDGAFLVAFSTSKVVDVHQGRVKLKGPWTSRALQAYQGDTVELLVPKYDHFDRLPWKDETGALRGFLERDKPYAMLAPEGAVEAGERERASRQGVQALDRSVPDVDPLAERDKLIATFPAAPKVPVGATLDASDDAKTIAEDRKASSADLLTKVETDRRNREAEDKARNARHSKTAAKFMADAKMPRLT